MRACREFARSSHLAERNGKAVLTRVGAKLAQDERGRHGEATAACLQDHRPVEEFHTYIENNTYLIPNYGERRRNRERISTATAESTGNQVISKRMVKRQQMRWSRRAAHLLLQVRTRELNGELESTFADWYPGLHLEPEPRKQAA